MKEQKEGRGFINFILGTILIGDLFMLVMWVLSSLGISPIPNYPPFLQLMGFLLVLAAVSFSLVENNRKSR